MSPFPPTVVASLINLTFELIFPDAPKASTGTDTEHPPQLLSPSPYVTVDLQPPPTEEYSEKEESREVESHPEGAKASPPQNAMKLQ
jgi:hypothetical protein